MAAFEPFNAYFRVVPERGPVASTLFVRKGGRFVALRSLQKKASQVYAALDNLTDTAGNLLILARPGGGQQSMNGCLSPLSLGTGVKPQFGSQPAQLMLEGFFQVADADPSDQAHNPLLLIHGGRGLMSGPSERQAYRGPAGLPVAAVEAQVTALKSLLEVGAQSIDPTISLYRLRYRGTLWGVSGHHFPR